MNTISILALFVLIVFSIFPASSASALSSSYYNRVCPEVLPTIKRVVEEAVAQERRMGASLLHLHFHDCLVNGSDASILLDQTSTIDSEKNAGPNANSARGFEVIDKIKSEVDKVCRRSVVSCADILTVAARDSVVALGFPSYKLSLSRRSSLPHLRKLSDTIVPSNSEDLQAILTNLRNIQHINQSFLVVLSGAHTLGFTQCRTFRPRIYNDTNIDQAFASHLRTVCPQVGGDSYLAPLDPTPASFDGRYFSNLVSKKGLLGSDQVLFNGGETDEIVTKYNDNQKKLFIDFAKSVDV
ncbi:peroxidase 70-like [Rutidosis leptorrhynchoides]|uniref:peroxidase 70-like n=1 Tax=Rutidosis leptorrhynchoides TaxID=125765 RepID=UPI003A9A4C4E